ncbi:MAG: hypothetical protein ACLFSQ_10380 [Candidatus Zixiibacteriota bacterium]
MKNLEMVLKRFAFIFILILAVSSLGQEISKDYNSLLEKSYNRIDMAFYLLDSGELSMARSEFETAYNDLSDIKEGTVEYEKYIHARYLRAISIFYFASLKKDLDRLEKSSHELYQAMQLLKSAKMKKDAYLYCRLLHAIIDYKKSYLAETLAQQKSYKIDAIERFKSIIDSKLIKSNPEAYHDLIILCYNLIGSAHSSYAAKSIIELSNFRQLERSLGEAIISFQDSEKLGDTIGQMLLQAEANHYYALFYMSIPKSNWKDYGVSVFGRAEAIAYKIEFSDTLLNRVLSNQKISKEIESSAIELKNRNCLIEHYIGIKRHCFENEYADGSNFWEIGHTKLLGYFHQQYGDTLARRSLYDFPVDNPEAEFWLGYIDIVEGNYRRAIGYFEQCTLKIETSDKLSDRLLRSLAMFYIAESKFHTGFTYSDTNMIDDAEDIYSYLENQENPYIGYLDENSAKWVEIRLLIIDINRKYGNISQDEIGFLFDHIGIGSNWRYKLRIGKFFASHSLRYALLDIERGRFYMEIAENLFVDIIENSQDDQMINEAFFLSGVFRIISYTYYDKASDEDLEIAREYLENTTGKLEDEAQLIESITYLIEGDTLEAVKIIDNQIQKNNMRAMFIKSFLIDDCIKRAEMLETIAISVKGRDNLFYREVKEQLDSLECRDNVTQQVPLIYEPMENTLKIEDIINISLTSNWREFDSQLKETGLDIFGRLFSIKKPLYYFDIADYPRPPIELE